MRWASISFSSVLEELHLLFHILFNLACCFQDRVHRHNVVGGRKDCDVVQFTFKISPVSISISEIRSISSPKNSTRTALSDLLRRKNLQYITAHTERTTVEIHLISGVLNIDQLPDNLIPVLSIPGRSEIIISM